MFARVFNLLFENVQANLLPHRHLGNILRHSKGTFGAQYGERTSSGWGTFGAHQGQKHTIGAVWYLSKFVVYQVSCDMSIVSKISLSKDGWYLRFSAVILRFMSQMIF